MAENKSSFTLHTLPTPGFILPACQIHIQACHGIHAAVTAGRRAPMPQEAPVASREATTLPAHLTCLPGRAAWGVRSPAPHVQDLLLVASSDLELASWSSLVRTVYYCAVGTRARFSPSERSSSSQAAITSQSPFNAMGVSGPACPSASATWVTRSRRGSARGPPRAPAPGPAAAAADR